ncbi:MAG TPA: SbcC/MukB-like Walker B domain-containing protein, partial [Kofleriaceae bacterium]|nr:SbcC/MukB-like Walker B domain-containing protein [Kofleriaceae bacterium]
IAAAAERLAGTMAELDAIAAGLAAITARDRQREREAARLLQLHAAAVASSAAQAATWRDQLGALGELMLVDDPATPEAEALAADRRELARGKLEAARLTRSQTEAATKAAQDAQAEVQLCQVALDQVTDKQRELDRRAADLDAMIGRVRGEHASKREQRAALAGELADAMARWLAALPGEPVARSPRGAGEVDAGLAMALVARLQAAAPVRRAPVAAPDSPLAIVRLAVAGVAGVWRERAERVAAADAALAAAAADVEREARDIDRAVAEHTARRGEAERRRAALAGELAAATARLDGLRGDAGFAHDELRRLLTGDPSRVDALSERLAALERAVDRTRAVVAERERQATEHAALRPGSAAAVAPGAAAPDLDALAAAVASAERRAAQLGATLAADAEARERRAGALAEVEAAELGAEVDRILGDVIGSHDGKLFRSFAQSLTLDNLLAVANAHLDELAPRYQLERVPRHDLELQVIDRDLGAEIRSVQSLSGGESFLVSLALALGLSSMSAHDVRVRTLLIDEGFGTLDPATLDSALSVLDALQATGRQVGVISHVPALVERVGAHVRVVQRGGGRSEVIVA